LVADPPAVNTKPVEPVCPHRVEAVTWVALTSTPENVVAVTVVFFELAAESVVAVTVVARTFVPLIVVAVTVVAVMVAALTDPHVSAVALRVVADRTPALVMAPITLPSKLNLRTPSLSASTSSGNPLPLTTIDMC